MDLALIAVWAALLISVLGYIGLYFMGQGYTKRELEDIHKQEAAFKKYHDMHFDHAKDHRLHVMNDTMSRDEIEGRFDGLEKFLKQHAEEDRRVQIDLREDSKEIREGQKEIQESLGKFYELIRQGRLT